MSKAIYLAAMEKWGRSKQILACIEELNECAAALSRRLNEKTMHDDQCLAELADAEIMLEQMRYYFDPGRIDYHKDMALMGLRTKLGVKDPYRSVTAQPELAPWIDRFALVPIIREWKHRWMKQEPRYSQIAYGIDANMVHDLADKLSDWLRAKAVKKGWIKE